MAVQRVAFVTRTRTGASLTFAAMTDSLNLHELNAQSAGIGAWVLRVHAMRRIEYEYVWQHQPKKGEKLECRLVAQDGVYCQGVIKGMSKSYRGGGVDPAADMKDMQDKFKDGTVWKMTKVALANEKSEYISSPVKSTIDLRKTKYAPDVVFRQCFELVAERRQNPDERMSNDHKLEIVNSMLSFHLGWHFISIMILS